MGEMIVPVLLAGGSGTRLWPISRKSHPKQFSKILGNNTLLQESALRMTSSDQINLGPPIIITNSDFRFAVGEQLLQVGIDPGPILIEPEPKNTAPAILAAALYATKKIQDAILVVTPSDHVMPDKIAFHHAISEGLTVLKGGQFVTFGVTPTKPETGYGYLELSKPPEKKAVGISRFIEKPEMSSAQQMFESGNYLWNTGIFLFRALDIIDSFKKYSPDMLSSVKVAIEKGKSDLGFFRLDPQAWSGCNSISIDYAIMEKAKNLVAVPFNGHWSDLGAWDTIWEQTHADENGVVISENASAIDCRNSLFRSEDKNMHLVGIGVEDIIAIAMQDAVLVARKDRAQDVKKVVDYLKDKNIAQAEILPKDHRPWGWFESLTLGNSFQVKRIFVKPKASLSLQSHRFRSEHWIVVEGTAKVIINDEDRILGEGESTYVPVGAIHRLINPGDVPMILIEVQTGSYFGEDDIKRYEDVYSRE